MHDKRRVKIEHIDIEDIMAGSKPKMSIGSRYFLMDYGEFKTRILFPDGWWTFYQNKFKFFEVRELDLDDKRKLFLYAVRDSGAWIFSVEEAAAIGFKILKSMEKIETEEEVELANAMANLLEHVWTLRLTGSQLKKWRMEDWLKVLEGSFDLRSFFKPVEFKSEEGLAYYRFYYKKHMDRYIPNPKANFLREQEDLKSEYEEDIYLDLVNSRPDLSYAAYFDIENPETLTFEIVRRQFLIMTRDFLRGSLTSKEFSEQCFVPLMNNKKVYPRDKKFEDLLFLIFKISDMGFHVIRYKSSGSFAEAIEYYNNRYETKVPTERTTEAVYKDKRPTNSTLLPEEYASFMVSVVKALPHDIDPDIACGWELNPDALAKALRETLCPPERD